MNMKFEDFLIISATRNRSESLNFGKLLQNIRVPISDYHSTIAELDHYKYTRSTICCKLEECYL